MSRKNLSLTKFGIDDSPHNMDGLRLLARDGAERVEAFIGRKVMDVWSLAPVPRNGNSPLRKMINKAVTNSGEYKGGGGS